MSFEGGIGSLADKMDDIRNRIGEPVVEIYFKSSTAVDEATGNTVSRTGPEAADIARKQIELGRDPWFLGRTEKSGLQKILQRLVKGIVSGAVGGPDETVGTLEQVGRFFVDLFRRHIEKGRSRGGKRMTPNAAGYRDWKRRTFDGAKILVRTGMLRDAVSYRVKTGANRT